MAPTIVVQRRSRVRGPLLAGLGAIAVLAAPLLYGLAQNASLRDARALARQAEQADAEVARMARQVRDLEARNQSLVQELTDLRKGREIDREAHAEVQKSLSAQQQELASLREQLAFYRGVMSPQALQSGLHVNELRLTAARGSGAYHYELVLVQAARQERQASGRVEMRFIGRDGAAVQRSLSLSDAGGAASLRFSFRHFQEFRGDLRFPPGFQPQRVVVTLMPDAGGSPHVEQEFEWGRVTGAAG